ncbi:MAG: type 1 glutamine amidotransferase [Methanomicrobiales archaeon]|nr:type 1 glutamine amidotransferase [Methanomicrobiales archaeon]
MKEHFHHSDDTLGMRPTLVAILEHEPHESAGLIEADLRGQGVVWKCHHLYRKELPTLEDATHLVVMGGSMSVHDHHCYPFLAWERDQVKVFVQSGRPVLGICLGAQQIASAFGGAVSSCHPEHGWSEVAQVRPGEIPGIPERFQIFQFHGETFEVPSGGSLLCTGALVKNQAFAIGSAVGIQFHPEISGEMVADWTKDMDKEIREKIRKSTAVYLPESTKICSTIINWFLSGWRGAFWK